MVSLATGPSNSESELTKCSIYIASKCAQAISEPVSPLFQCQYSEESELVYTPNIPDSYFNDSNAARLRRNKKQNLSSQKPNFAYIFTESAQQNCSGIVASIQYCYQARESDIGQKRDAFNLLSLVQDGQQFTVNSRITIQTTPQESICTDIWNMQQICCDKTFLNATNRFQIPSAFGVVIINNTVRPLVFANSTMQYRVKHYRTTLENFTIHDRTFTLRKNQVPRNRSLLLLRFLLGELLKVSMIYS